MVNLRPQTKMNTEPQPRIYRIIRYRHANRSHRTIRSNVTLTEAQAHCRRPDTKGEGWFDGYEYMRGCAPQKITEERI